MRKINIDIPKGIKPPSRAEKAFCIENCKPFQNEHDHACYLSLNPGNEPFADSRWYKDMDEFDWATLDLISYFDKLTGDLDGIASFISSRSLNYFPLTEKESRKSLLKLYRYNVLRRYKTKHKNGPYILNRGHEIFSAPSLD